MRVLIITPAFPPGMHVGGGVAITYKVLSEELARRGVDVQVLSTWNGELDYFNSVFDVDFRLIDCNMTNLRRLRKEIAASDVVVYPDNILLPYLALETMMQQKPCIWVFHTHFLRLAEYHMNAWEHKFFDFLVNFVLGICSRLHSNMLTTSRDFASYLNNYSYKLGGYIDQGFKTAVFAREDPPEALEQLRKDLTDGQTDRPVMVFAGRLSNEKRINLLVDAKPEEFVLVIIGDGYLRDQLKELECSRTGFKVITEMVAQEKLRQYYKVADLVVSASDFETYGMTIHEALVCGTPVVVQDAGGFKSQVVHEDNGFLIDFADSEHAKQELRRALNFKFNVYPPKDPNAVDFTQVVIDTAKVQRQPVSKIVMLFFVIIQYMFIWTLRFLRIFYAVNTNATASKLEVGPKQLHQKHVKVVKTSGKPESKPKDQ